MCIRDRAKIAAENFGAAIGFAAGAALAVKEKLDEQAARAEQKKQQHEQTMGDVYKRQHRDRRHSPPGQGHAHRGNGCCSEHTG